MIYTNLTYVKLQLCTLLPDARSKASTGICRNWDCKNVWKRIYIYIVLDCVVGSCSDSEFNVPTLQVHMFGPACCLHACLPACLPAALIESIVLQLLQAGREEFPQASVATPT
jgi:hypothetical protein